MNSTVRTILFWIALLVTAVLLYQVVQHTQTGREQDFTFTRFMQEVERANVKRPTPDPAARKRAAPSSTGVTGDRVQYEVSQ